MALALTDIFRSRPNHLVSITDIFSCSFECEMNYLQMHVPCAGAGRPWISFVGWPIFVHCSLTLQTGFWIISLVAGIWVSVRLLDGDLKQVRESYPHLIVGNTIVARKMGFPEVIMPCEYNPLYPALRDDTYSLYWSHLMLCHASIFLLLCHNLSSERSLCEIIEFLHIQTSFMYSWEATLCNMFIYRLHLCC